MAATSAPPDAYIEFCQSYPEACTLGGASILEWTPVNRLVIEQLNINVNQEIVFVHDWELNGLDDVCDYPYQCTGDCEDFALEKRRRLVEAGFPSASLTMAIAYHTDQLFPHAVLLIESDQGTWVLDNVDDPIRCWDAVPYTFTSRERPDGLWDRFVRP